MADWSSLYYVAAVPGDTTTLTDVLPPVDWGQFSNLRFFLTAGGELPDGVKLDYIGASGTQRIMTSFTPNGTSAVEVEFSFSNTSGTQNIFCSRGDSNNSDTFTLFWMGEKWRWDYNTSMKYSNAQTPGAERHTMHVDSSGIVFDGTLLSGTPQSAASFTAAGTMSLFASHASGTGHANFGKWKLYSFKAWQDGSDDSTLKLDLVPCRKFNGTVCLYNKVDGKYLTNAGSGNFAGGAELPTELPAIVTASDLVSVPVTGWLTASGTFYPYVTPLYVAEVVDGSSSVGEVTFKMVTTAGSSVTTDVSYAEFVGEARTGTIIKRGNGTLTFNQDLSTFTGPVHVEEGVAIGVCSNCFGRTEKVSPPNANQRTYVHSGATLVMDAVNNTPVPAESNGTYYEGDGYPGMGGAFVARNGDTASGTSRWQMGCGARAVGPATIYLDVPAGGQVGIMYGAAPQAESNFSLNGQDVLMHGRTVGSVFSIGATRINEIGNFVISNMTLLISGNSGCILPKNGNSSTIHFRGGARWLWQTDDNLNLIQLNQTASVYIDDLEYIRLYSWRNVDNNNYGVNPWGAFDGNGTTNNWYCGPVVLNDHIRLYNLHSPRNSSDKRKYGCTFSAKVSGPKGFRPWYNSNGVCWGDGTRINLLYPTNTFEGGIVMDGGSLGVWAECAVPSQEGAGLVSITNGYVYFGRYGDGRARSTRKWVEFTMPVTELVGNCAVTNGTGTWKGLVKKGAGTLDYNSQLGGDYLDLQEGTVKFNTQYRENYTGEYATYAPDGYEEALPVFTTLKGTEGVLDLADVGGAYTVANVEGSPSVTNGNLTVTGTWAVDAATVGIKVANVSGTLAFGEGSTMVVAGDLESVSRPADGFVVARAASISGKPRLINSTGWRVVESNGVLRLAKPGLLVLIR